MHRSGQSINRRLENCGLADEHGQCSPFFELELSPGSVIKPTTINFE